MLFKFLTINCLRQIIFLLALMIGFGLFAVHLGQDANWDLKNYHWYNAYSLLYHRLGWDIAPAMLMTYYNPLFDLVNYFIIQLSPTPKIAEFILGTFHGIAVYFLFKIAEFLIKTEIPLLRYFYIIVAVSIGVTGAASYAQIGTTHNESQISIFIMAAVFCMLKFINDSESKHLYFCALSGFILGLGVGFKLTAISYAIAFFIALLVYKRPDIKYLKALFMAGIMFCAGFFLAGGYWMWTLYQHFHNPLFPYYNNIFHSPYIPYGGFTDRRFMPRNFISYLFYPFYWLRKNTLVEELGMADPRVAIAMVLGILYAFKTIVGRFLYKSTVLSQPSASDGERYSMRFLLVFLVVSYIVWLLQFSIYRYAIPINFLAGLFIVYFCLRLFSSKSVQLLAVLIVCWLIVADTQQPDWGRVKYRNSFFDVHVPVIEKNSIVLLIGGAPRAYLISQFPASVRFVGIDNNIINASNVTMKKLAVTTIEQSKAALYGIADHDFSKEEKDSLKAYGLTVSTGKCQFIQSNMEYAPVPICPVMRIKKTTQ